ncbi:MAG: helix-turn-helix domain-containing protein [Bauldia sp.]
MTESLPKLLLQLSEAGPPAILPGNLAKHHFGPDFDALLHQRLLKEAAPASEWATCASCECGLHARPVQRIDGRLVAACPLSAALDAELDEDDLRTFEIDIPAIVRRMASESGFGSEPEEVMEGVWLLGFMPDGRAVFVAPSPYATKHQGLIAVLRVRAGESPVTIVSAMSSRREPRLADAGIHCVALQDACHDGPELSFGLDLQRLVPAASTKARLIVNRPGNSATLDGIEKLLSPRSFDVLWLLAVAAYEGHTCVSRSELAKGLWGAAPRGDRAVDDAVRDLRRQLGTGRSSSRHSLIVTRQAEGYQLGLRPEEIRLIP